VQEGLQNGLNRLVRLGLDVGGQLGVALPLVLVENLLDLWQRGKGITETENI